jgi:ABC-type nickel/cobalt efflux system permease component RcnA
MTLKTTLAAATTAVALTVAAVPALMVGAQSATAQTTETAYSATQLDAFVAAFLEVSELRSTYTDRLQQSTEEAEQQAIVEEGNAAIVAAIEEVEGMDVELYSAILEQAAADPALNDRLTQRLQDAAAG